MNRYGDGSIYYDESRQRWVGQIEVEGTSGKRRYRRVTSTKSKADVRSKLAIVRAEQEAGLPVADRSVTVKQYLTDWLAHTVPTFAESPNTVENYRWAVEGHLVPAIGSRRLVALSPAHVERMLRDRAKEGMTTGTLRRLRTVLAKALTHAEKRGHVARNVARIADVPKGKASTERRSMTPDEARQLLVALDGHRSEAPFTTMLLLGLRPAELLGLCWDCVDLEAATVTVRRTMKFEEHDRPRFGEPKTTRSNRVVRCPDCVARLLRAHKATQAELRLAAGPRWSNDWPGLVFTSEVGTPIDRHNLRRELVAVTSEAGLGTWTSYELRHSAVSLLAEAGVPLHNIADALGTSVRMLERHYLHRVSDVVEGAAAPMDAMFAG